MIYVCRDPLDGTCGVEVLYDYTLTRPVAACYWSTPLSNLTIGGIGYAVAGFINNDVCRQAYDEVCERFHLVYQSPVKLNLNSGNDFFFCIFRNK